MAKYQRKIRGDFDKILKAIDEAVRIKSSTASLEDVADYYGNGVRSALRVYAVSYTHLTFAFLSMPAIRIIRKSIAVISFRSEDGIPRRIATATHAL